ncbi:hypothetical protein QR685DRAFT_570334 [Neurospora intermedia]|uniref:Uncharacterized protein n=1 Tax=Neurospora intermedia TaxID=5142 RepID=A0ABR3DFV6_NEUIN
MSTAHLSRNAAYRVLGPPSSDHPRDQLPIAQTPIAPPQITTTISTDTPAEGSSKKQKKREIFQEQLDAPIAKLDDAMKRIDTLTAKANQHDALIVRCDTLEGFIIRRPR